MKRLCVVIAVAAGSLVAAGTAAARADFVTPGRAAYCLVSHAAPAPHLICWRPLDGLTLQMQRRGPAHKGVYRPNRHYDDPRPGRVLHFGQTWTRPGFWRCTSRSSGLTCTNSAGHGWRLGRFRRATVF